MALGRYLGGIGLFILGLLILTIGAIAAAIKQTDYSGICAIFSVIGILLILIGGFYTRTAHQRVPTKVEIVQNSRQDRFCPDCGRAIPFDANIYPYCGKKF